MASNQPESADAFLGMLQGERQRLQNAVEHLQQSNRDLKQAIEETGPDRDFKEAIEENIVVIAKYVARIERLDKEIAELQRGLQCLHEGGALLAGGEGPAQEQQPREGDGGGSIVPMEIAGAEGQDTMLPHEQPMGAGGQQEEEVLQRDRQPPGQEEGLWV